MDRLFNVVVLGVWLRMLHQGVDVGCQSGWSGRWKFFGLRLGISDAIPAWDGRRRSGTRTTQRLSLQCRALASIRLARHCHHPLSPEVPGSGGLSEMGLAASCELKTPAREYPISIHLSRAGEGSGWCIQGRESPIDSAV